jgi:23S rRNA pseudouridine2605 synthase
VRLAKYMAQCGVASRRHAERLVTSGRVFVGGRRVTDPAHDVSEADEVTVEGKRISPQRLEYHLLHKPLGVVSTAHDPEGRPKVTDMVPSDVRLYPVGRLDADSSGLILLTNDGALANRLTHPSFEVEKAYRAEVEGGVAAGALERLRQGVELDDGMTSPARVRELSRGPSGSVLELVIHEGRKRQVRRMLESVGHRVRSLQRVRFGPLELGDLKPGASRPLEAAEIEALAAAGSPS